jgi:hypothetical protein
VLGLEGLLVIVVLAISVMGAQLVGFENSVMGGGVVVVVMRPLCIR